MTLFRTGCHSVRVWVVQRGNDIDEFFKKSIIVDADPRILIRTYLKSTIVDADINAVYFNFGD